MAPKHTFLLALAAASLLASPVQAEAPDPADALALVPLTAPVEAGEALPDVPAALARAADRILGADGPGALAILDALTGPVAADPRARFLRAEALRLEGRCAEAAPTYEAVLLEGPLLVDRVRLHLGECLIQLRHFGDAAAVLGAVAADHPAHPEAVRLRGRALLSAGEAEKALAVLEAHRDSAEASDADRAALAVVLGEVHAALGAEELAVLRWREALLTYPAGPQAPIAARLLSARLRERDPAAAAGWGRLGHALLGGERALSALTTAGLPAELRPVVAYVRARRATDAGVAAALYAEAADTAHDDPDLAARARFALGVATRDLGRSRTARQAFERMAARHPEHPLAPSARLEAATLALRDRDYAAAELSLSSLLLLYPVAPERPRALFLLGWSHLRQASHTRASEFFAAAAREAPEEAAREDEPGAAAITSGARSLYWAARALELAGDATRAQLGFSEVLGRYPLSYYAELARSHLARGGSVALPEGAPSPAHAEDPRVRRAREALSLGWRGEAWRALRPLAADPGLAPGGKDLLAAAGLMDHLGHTAAGRAVYREAVMRRAGDLTPAEREDAWRRAFPRYYGEHIEREAARQGYSAWLLYGLVLRESGFVRCAQSGVGARGLAQIMMPTARDAARDLGLQAPTPDLLCDPAYNLRLGAWHFKKLLRRYHGSEILALAAYNAGQGNVDRWLRRHPDLPLDAFVEEIPYDETRAYVRKVISAGRGYAWIYGEPGTAGVGVELGAGPAADHGRRVAAR